MRYRIGRCLVTVCDAEQWLTTRFPSGREVAVAVAVDPGLEQLALDLGYGEDLWQMSRDHELAHSWLAVQQGWPWSWALYQAGGGTVRRTAGEIEEEEFMVLVFQKYLRKEGARPWDSTMSVSADTASMTT